MKQFKDHSRGAENSHSHPTDALEHRATSLCGFSSIISLLVPQVSISILRHLNQML
jgi:hypothetical protein